MRSLCLPLFCWDSLRSKRLIRSSDAAVGSPCLWSLLAPSDAALRAHFALQGMLAGSGVRSFENQAPGNARGLAPVSPGIARHLVMAALGRQSARLPRWACALSRQAFLHARLAQRRCLRRSLTMSIAKHACANRNPASGACGALVLTLQWPGRLNTNQAFAGGCCASARPCSAGHRHWALAKALVIDYARARRRQLRERWLAIVAAALDIGRKTACKLEVIDSHPWLDMLTAKAKSASQQCKPSMG